MTNRVKNIMLENRFWQSIVRKEIPVNEWIRGKTLGLGLINFYLFVILTLTGILLMFYYAPQTPGAYRDIKDLEYVVSFGTIFRNMHHWAAYLMIISVFLHLSRVFYTAEYKHPREFNWVIGIVLFFCTLGMGLSGYLLLWDQKAYWGATIMSNIVSSIPPIGAMHKYLILGGTQVGQNFLERAYTMHVKVLPLVLSLIMMVHFWRNRKDDMLAEAGERAEQVESGGDNSSESGEARKQLNGGWLDIIKRELSKFLLILGVVMAMSLLFNAPLEEMANPSVTPNPTKAIWFFVGLQELLSWGPPFWFGVVIPNVVVLFLILIPYLDRGRLGIGVWFHPSRRLENILFTAFAVILMGLIVVGQFMRGPGWVFYWPWQPWPPTVH
jgi:quinol-cytochrome oxidoreductase complex cytochrome b subunit